MSSLPPDPVPAPVSSGLPLPGHGETTSPLGSSEALSPAVPPPSTVDELLAARGLLSEAAAWPEICGRSELVNQLCQEGRYREARDVASDLKRFIVTRCLPSPALEAKLNRLEGTLQRLDECGFGPGAPATPAVDRVPRVTLPATAKQGKTALVACVLVAVIGLVSWAGRILSERSLTRTEAGFFALPASSTTHDGDGSDGWMGCLDSTTRGWLVMWRFMGTPSEEADAAGNNRLLLLRLRSAFQGLKKVVPIDQQSVAAQGHRANRVTYSMKTPQSVDAVSVSWYCEESHRFTMVLFWDDDDARRKSAVEAFERGRGRCHGTDVKPASPLPQPCLSLPAGFKQTQETAEYTLMENESGERVWIGKGLPRVGRGDFYVEELQEVHYDRLPTVKERFDGVVDTLPVGRSPHVVFRTQGMGFPAEDARPPCRPQVSYTWFCRTTGRVYVVAWQGRKQNEIPFYPGLDTPEPVPHPPYMDVPCCVKQCQDAWPR